MKKDEQIRMLLHPEDYTDEQLDQMLDETDVEVPDANEAWERFEEEQIGKEHVVANLKFATHETRISNSRQRNWYKIAATFVGVLMLSGIAYAAYRMVGSMGGDYKSPTQETRIANSRQQVTNEEAKDSTAMKPVVYEDAELATILNEIATFYQCEVVYKTETSKHIRFYFTWNKKVTIDDIIDTFNKFERIHITRDNKKLIVE